jgi:hypothetical protein
MAEQELEARRKEFLTGRGTLDYLLESARRRLTAELALDADPAAAWERLWTQLYEIETVNRRRYEDGSIPIQDYALARYHQLDAAIGWASVRAAGKR